MGCFSSKKKNGQPPIQTNQIINSNPPVKKEDEKPKIEQKAQENKPEAGNIKQDIVKEDEEEEEKPPTIDMRNRVKPKNNNLD